MHSLSLRTRRWAQTIFLFLFLSTATALFVTANAQTVYHEEEVTFSTENSLVLDSNGQPVNGVVQTFHDNGMLQQETPYVNGKIEGVEKHTTSVANCAGKPSTLTG